MALTANQRIQTLERQVRFLQQRLPVSETTGAALQVAITALEVAVAELVGMIDPGDPDGFMDWGASSKGNAINIFSPTGHAGYHREVDSVHAGGQILCGTLNDAATILLYRQQTENPGSSTGWGGDTGVARIDFVAVDKNGDVIYPNGADSAFSTITSRLAIPDSGDDAVDGWGSILISCINELQSSTTKQPKDILMVTGENGGEIWGYKYNSSGAVVLSTKIFG